MVADRHVHAALVDLASAVADFGRNLAGHFAQLGLDRDVVDRAGEGVAAIERGLRPLSDFEAIEFKHSELNPAAVVELGAVGEDDDLALQRRLHYLRQDPKSVVLRKSESFSVDPGCRRHITK